jgi:hypothetical protein
VPRSLLHDPFGLLVLGKALEDGMSSVMNAVNLMSATTFRMTSSAGKMSLSKQIGGISVIPTN